MLLGVSLGSNVGAQLAKGRPDLFYAYVGTGQAVNQKKYRPLAYSELLAEAHARKNRQPRQELESNGQPPYDSFARATIHTKWANAIEPGQPSAWGSISTLLFESDAGVEDLFDYVQGLRTNQDHFRDAIEAKDLQAIGTDFDIPVFIFQGAQDRITPVEARALIWKA